MASPSVFNDWVGARRQARAIAAVLTVVAVLSWASLMIFFVRGGPWGTLNDAGNGVLALLCGALAFALHRPSSLVATTVAVLGAATGLLGSFLVISDTTGYFLAGLVSAFGFALVGLWLVVVGRADDVVARRLAQTAGAVMALGLVNIVGIVQGLDDQTAAPGWLFAAGVCWAGTYLLLPMWTFRYARHSPSPLDGAAARAG